MIFCCCLDVMLYFHLFFISTYIIIYPSHISIYLLSITSTHHTYLSSIGTYLFEQAANGEETTTINSFRDALNHFIISKDLKK